MTVSFQVYRGSSTGKIKIDTVTRELHSNEVYIETTHSGVCGTDEHFVKSTQVLGHEGIGIVQMVGSNVTNVKIGDRVGFGYVQNSCDDCDDCRKGAFVRVFTNVLVFSLDQFLMSPYALRLGPILQKSQDIW